MQQCMRSPILIFVYDQWLPELVNLRNIKIYLVHVSPGYIPRMQLSEVLGANKRGV